MRTQSEYMQLNLRVISKFNIFLDKTETIMRKIASKILQTCKLAAFFIDKHISIVYTRIVI